MNLVVMSTVFGIIFLGELPDKTMFAALVLASRGRPGPVWLGASAAFVLHAAIAVTIGEVLFTLLPYRATQAFAAALFLLGALLALRDRGEDEEQGEDVARQFGGNARHIVTAFAVIFMAEWGDLTQILTANLAVRYHSPIEVGVAAALALCAVAGLAMLGGRLLRNLPVVVVRRVTGVVLLALAGLSAFSAVTGYSTIV